MFEVVCLCGFKEELFLALVKTTVEINVGKFAETCKKKPLVQKCFVGCQPFIHDIQRFFCAGFSLYGQQLWM